MTITPFQSLACPLDGAPLQRAGASLRCGSGHCFDVASLGYTHLLPVQNKRSLDPGDSKAMVAARRRFLNLGAYRPIAAAVNRALLDGLPATGVASCLDAGCGEGYYLRQLAQATEADRQLALLGVDISKWAVAAAARQDRRPNWLVASNARLPVLPATIDRVLCLFGFPVWSEFARVLKAGGELLLVDPGPDHLRELRAIIYPTLKPERPGNGALPPGFTPLPGEDLRYALELDTREAIADLLAMTPHLHRASAEGRARAGALDALTLTVDVRLTRLRRGA
jgi:23S rRNA (guanine745-N1)-methyltransferase